MKKLFMSIKNWVLDFFPRLWTLFKKSRFAQIFLAIIILIAIALTVREIFYDEWQMKWKERYGYTTPAAGLLEELERRDSLEAMGVKLEPMDWEKYK